MSLSLITTGILGGSLGLPTDGIIGSTFTVILDVDTVPDIGGTKVTMTGVWPVDEDIFISVTDNAKIDRECYSGVIGQGFAARSLDGFTLAFITPPLPPFAGYDIVITPAVSPGQTAIGALTAIHRTFVSTLFGLRSVAARPRYVGPYTIEDED